MPSHDLRKSECIVRLWFVKASHRFSCTCRQCIRSAAFAGEATIAWAFEILAVPARLSELEV